MINRNVEREEPNEPRTYCYQLKDAAIMAVNVAIAQLAELAADLHAHDDDEDDLFSIGPELAALLSKMEFVGRWLVMQSDPNDLQQFVGAGSNYVSEWMEQLHGRGLYEHAAINEAIRREDERSSAAHRRAQRREGGGHPHPHAAG